MRCLIVEDSRLARQELKHLLEAFPEIDLVGEAENAEQALELIDSLKPELLFLDIQIPGKDGFELLESLDEAPAVVFTTAYDQYALKAFDYNALDYLQKPIQKDRLTAAIEKVTASARVESTPSSDATPLAFSSQVFVKDGERCWFVKLSNIRLFEIDGSYTRIHFSDQTPMIPKTLNQLEMRLDPLSFFRANRQQIINLKAIQSIEPWFSGGLKLTLSCGTEVEISRRQASKFKKLTSL
ncbi:LytTR family DNA-binding domain-containing protein [Pelagicoccus sp. SDUM812002]|uniref:LytR/AlgR family response regulator transcription factor n=1 Tax=Pelagicoccus sp. SDUM812002 TaxID=3041266 RepID=UPI00281071AF|nr:LytTR family DNA-binding domain-containing protein [Pelagicoccus sp. SDUM812002]MDQ8188114.1 LytTR family DNA-binding domain-containing protein [Pelagicoccus sp. SDUM812002]